MTKPSLHKHLAYDDQYLSPEPIYSLNRVLDEILDEQDLPTLSLKTEDVWIVPNLFNKSTRTWHFACVAKEFWGLEPESGEFLNGAVSLLARIALNNNSLKQAFDNATFNLLKGPAYDNAVEILSDCVKNTTDHLSRCGTCNGKTPVDATLISCLAQGLGFRDASGAIKLGASRTFHTSLLLVYHGFKVHRFQTLAGILYRGCCLHLNDVVNDFAGVPEGQKIPRSYLGKYAGIEGMQDALFDQFDSKLENGCKLTKDDFETGRGGKVVEELASLFYLTKSLVTNLLEGSVIVLPIYDTWLRSSGYGGLWGCLICTFKNTEAKQAFICKLDEFGKALEFLSAELTISAMASVSSHPINPPYDLVEHFLRTLIRMQDWERVSVFRRGVTRTLLYCYKRRVEADDYALDYDWGWGTKNDCCSKKPQARLLSWDHRGHIWRKALIPELTNEEKTSFGDITFEFEFPASAFLPEDRIEQDLFELQLIEQQIHVLRTLIPKVRARRAALRNAAVSIMSRNMSHNIGSHVLAAVRGDQEVVDPVVLPTLNTRIQKLNEHLQRRMDFIAELATVEALSAADNLLFHEVLGAESNGVDGRGQRGLNAQSLLLRHISGVQVSGQPVGAVINVIREANGDTVPEATVSFYSGVLGWQALYVILENIIRNVAKHTRQATGACAAITNIEVFLKVLDTHYDYFEVRIWDRSGTACEPVRDGSGKTVVKYLADTLDIPTFLDADNTIAKKDWGMKEMYVSAAFLRGIALSDLEGRLPEDQPTVIQACAVDDEGEAVCCHKNGEGQAGATHCKYGGAYKNLGFKLWLPKAKTVAIIVDDVAKWRESFGAAGETASNGVAIEEQLKAKGVDFYPFNTACSAGTRIPHRYGVWLSEMAVPDERRAGLPVALLENDGKMTQALKNMQVKGGVDGLILCVRKRVLEKRRERVAPGSDFQLWTCDGQITRGTQCGENLNDLAREQFTKAVVFDWHGEGVHGRLTPWLIDWLKAIPERADAPLRPDEVIDGGKGFAFYESHRTPFPQTGLFASLVKQGHANEQKEAFENEVLCAALTPVLILDERFQRVAAQRLSADYEAAVPRKWGISRLLQEHFSMGKIWKRMGVHVPLAQECDLERPKLDDIRTYLNAIDTRLGRGAYIVVHQSIFEKLGAQEEHELTRCLADKAGTGGWVNVVCSGRGVPWQLQGKDRDSEYRPRFIALSALLQCLEHMPSKLHLIRLLEVTRAPSRT